MPLFPNLFTLNNTIYLCTLQDKEFTTFSYILIIGMNILMIYIHFPCYFNRLKALFFFQSTIS